MYNELPIKTFKDVAINNDDIIKIKVAFIYEMADESLYAFIDENNYLYEISYSFGYGWFNKTSESKVVEVKKVDDKYDILFANGDRRRLSDVEAYK